MKSVLPVIVLCCLAFLTRGQQKISGIVRSHAGPIRGASVRIKSSGQETATDSSGHFSFPAYNSKNVIVVSHLGFQTKEVSLLSTMGQIDILLEEAMIELKDIYVSTGYQAIPKERATGSFVQVDSALINRSVSTRILDRLEGVTSGLVFNKGISAGGNPISIRGQNTIYGNANPLIVIDNFPYEGSIDNINPNDVESITVLKDAAAASIWGSRAGNGVMVITTKKGRLNQAPQVSLNASVTIGKKPNIFYQPRMSSSDFIDVEKMLFTQGYYQAAETSYRNEAITPVAEILIAERDGKISAAQGNAQIDAFRNNDVRNDFEKYFYRKSVNQQYALNVSGGSSIQKYYLSAGIDQNTDNLVGNGYSRITLNAGNTISLLKNKLSIASSLYYTQSNTLTNNPGTDYIVLNSGSGLSLYPYAQLADSQRNPLAITHNYRQSFIEAAEQSGLMDWSYKPLQEVRVADNTSKSTDYRINTSLKYKILPSLSAEVLYQYNQTLTTNRNLMSDQSYYTRDLINTYTQVGSSGTLTYPVPLGSILDLGNITVNSHSVRGQLDYSQSWNQKNELNAIAGYELKDYHTTGTYNRMYGYDQNHAIASPVDYISSYPQYFNTGNTITVPFNDYAADLTDRYISYYANAAYTYSGKYIISGSGRLDRSNLFGVKTNQQGVPLYSAGFAWIASNENFYHLSWLPYLKFRATYGYNGNVNKSLSAYTTAVYLTGNLINQTYAEIKNPPNPELRWERVKIINLGVDFASLGNRISGTIEPYFKKGIDLIGDIAFAPSTGITTFRGNTANTKGKGIDVTLNTRNINGNFQWFTNILFSYVSDKVVDYNLSQASLYYTQYANNETYPLEGRPFYAVYSYKWAGLDPKTGDPQGFVNGLVSKDYSAIVNAPVSSVVYNGPARPTTFGSVRNTISWRQVSLSAIVSYRLGYFFRKYGIYYGNVLTGQGYDEGNYSKRWQKPGDETVTSIPSAPASIDYNRDSFYNYSEATVEKGDNVRLQDLRLGYDLTKKQILRLPVRQVQFYVYASNLGIIWKATKTGLDPDYPSASYIPVRTVAAGIRVNF